MKRALVTGASGFIGRHVCQYLLDREVYVIAVGRRDAVDVPCSEYRKLDLLNFDLMSLMKEIQPDTLVHLAWSTEHGKFWSTSENLPWAGVSLKLLHTFSIFGGRRAVFTGSCAEYDLLSEALFYAEREDCPAPNTLYGTAKDATRRICENYSRLNDISFAWARIFFVFGPGENPDRLGGALAKSIANGEEALCSSGRQIRDFLSSQDAGAAIAALALSDVNGPVNIGSGQPMSIAEFAKTFGRRAGKPELVRLGALQDRPGEAVRIVADISRLKNEVGFRPSASFEQRVDETLLWWRRLFS